MPEQVRTLRPDGTQPRWLGELGPVTGVRRSYAYPGGCDQLSCTLVAPARLRTEALDPGRRVEVCRGADVIWDGQLDEPGLDETGWQITAHGSGTFGAQKLATFSVWSTGTVDQAVNNAISRGLRWVNPGVGSPAGMYMGQKADSGSVFISDLLEQACSKGGLSWRVARTPAGNILTVEPLPTTVTRLLVATSPVARTLGGDVNAIGVRYQATKDTTKHPATFALAWATDAASIDKHDRTEVFMDLSSAGKITAGQAQDVANYVLARYQRANWAGPFTVTPGDLLTTGGTPVDLGTEQAGGVCRLLLTDFGYGGEVKPGPAEFIVGAYEYDDDAHTAQITPFQSLRTDFAALLALRAETWHPKRRPGIRYGESPGSGYKPRGIRYGGGKGSGYA